MKRGLDRGGRGPSAEEAFGAAPVLAVLRGVRPEEAEAAGAALVSAGVRALEVTLDSPEPFDSLRRLDQAFGAEALIAAGTVLRADQVGPALDAGARLIVAPNFSPAVVAEAVRHGAPAAPGVATPSEALAALDAGAAHLKLFPGDMIPPKAVKAMRAVLPAGASLIVTGGVDLANARAYLDAGAAAVGVGSALFSSGVAPDALRLAAARYVAAAIGADAPSPGDGR